MTCSSPVQFFRENPPHTCPCCGGATPSRVSPGGDNTAPHTSTVTVAEFHCTCQLCSSFHAKITVIIIIIFVCWRAFLIQWVTYSNSLYDGGVPWPRRPLPVTTHQQPSAPCPVPSLPQAHDAARVDNLNLGRNYYKYFMHCWSWYDISD